MAKRVRPKRLIVSIEPILSPTSERVAHGPVVVVTDRHTRSVVQYAQDPLDRYGARKELTVRQFAAGRRLREDYELGVIGVREATGLPVLVSGGARGSPYPEQRLAAIERYKRAVKTIGPSLAGIVIAVCCEAVSAEALAQRQLGSDVAPTEVRRRRDQVKWYLRAGLDSLADHYRFGFDHPASPASSAAVS